METIRLCPKCGKPLAPNAPQGICPECLMKGAFPTGSDPGSASKAPAWTPPAPQQLQPHFPQLEILELLGAGGMGAVYKAIQKKLDRTVALKILPLETARDPAFAERFTREAKALARLNHPNIVTVYDFGQSGAYFFFIMEFVEGTNLRALITDKSMDPRQALEMVMQICTALQFAHDEKIVHRDIKPENILISKKGQVKIADFGLAKLMGPMPDTSLTASQMVMGTLNYMAPEQRENSKDVDHRADIYSLGVVFYEMLTGQVPMGRFDPPSKKVQVDVRLDEVVLHALEREPERRYQQVSEVRSNVEAISASLQKRQPTEPAAEIIKPKPTPGFLRFFWKPFAIYTLVYLLTCAVLRWAMGDLQLIFDPAASLASKAFLLCAVLIVSVFSFTFAKFLVPAGFGVAVWTWLEARERRGLKLRQFSPRCRRRHLLWSVVSAVMYLAVALGTLAVFYDTSAFQKSLYHDMQRQSDQAMEWWFAPNDKSFEKLGFRLNFSKESGNRAGYYGAPPPCTVSLIVHQTNEPPATMTVVVPGLQANYRIPLTNSFAYDVVLDRDSLIDWLHKGASLNPAASKFKEQADEIYSLLKAYQTSAPETGMEFVNLAKADLTDFWFSGAQSSGFTYSIAPALWILWTLMAIETLVYSVVAYWTMKRIYRNGWAEIEAGLWNPPPRPANLARYHSRALAVLLGFTVVAAMMALIAGARGRINEAILIMVSWVAIAASAISLYRREQIKAARREGLWPQPGEAPTLDHVKRLAQAGEMVLAIKLYRTIYSVPLVHAKAAVEKLTAGSMLARSPSDSPPAAPESMTRQS